MIKNRMFFLDYLRVLAFTLVLIGHQFNKDLYLIAGDTSVHVTLRTIAAIIADASFGGVMGVVLFFLISGYIITHVLQSEGTLEFFIKRIFRIYPLYITAVVIDLAIQHFDGKEIPSLIVIVPRLLLIGDFFDTPLSLGQVEWTLRIEVIFYLMMGALRSIGIIKNSTLVTITLFIITSSLYFTGPLPVSSNFHNGYINIFAPFLFIGVIIYYAEHKMINLSLSALVITFIFYTHLSMAELYTPTWIRFNYSIVGSSIFIFSLLIKDRFKITTWCAFLSELTYAVYLMHKFMWDPLLSIVVGFKLHFIPNSIQIVVLLLLICYLLNIFIEKNGMKLGKLISNLCKNNH